MRFYVGKLYGWFRVCVNLPKAVFWKGGDMSRKDMLIIVKRAGKARYHDRYREQKPCGCFGIGKRYTSYVSDCEEHGVAALFRDVL